MSAPEPWDVLVVGGGPAGLSVAAGAAAGGARVIVVHQDREIGHPVRSSGGSWVADLTALGVPERLWHRIDTLIFRSDGALSRHPMPRHPMAVLDVTGLYRWLAEQAAEAGADIRCATKFTAIEPAGAGFVSTVRGRDGREARIASARVVDASGTPCAVLAAAGRGARPARTGIGIEAEFVLQDGPDRDAVLIVGDRVPAGYGWIFPAPHGHVRIGAGIIHPDVALSPKALLDGLLTPEFLAAHRLTLGAAVQTNAGVIPSEPYDRRLVHGGIVRVGDSANFATPTVGEGIRIAIAQGRLLGRALAQGGDAPLRRWETACRRAFARDYALGFMANRRMATYTAADWDRSVTRLQRLDEAAVAALVRSEFGAGLMLRTLTRQVAHRIARSWRRGSAQKC